jgi:hypothetical protein
MLDQMRQCQVAEFLSTKKLTCSSSCSLRKGQSAKVKEFFPQLERFGKDCGEINDY